MPDHHDPPPEREPVSGTEKVGELETGPGGPAERNPGGSKAVLLLVPRAFCSQDYRAKGLPEGPVEVRFNALTEQGEIRVGEHTFRVRKHGPASGHWTLEHEGTVLAEAEKPSALRSRFRIRTIEGTGFKGDLTLSPKRLLGGTWTLSYQSRLLGEIRPVHPFTRRMRLECEPSVGLLIRLFAFWVVGMMRRRSAAAAAS